LSKSKLLVVIAVSSIQLASAQCVVDWNDVHQRIDGFGASSAWQGSWTTSQADMFFSTNTGIGLSLLRNHITAASSTASSATPSTSETSIMQMAQARGATVWSTPWTPAAGFKSNNSLDGGSYRGNGNNATNQAYAVQLANYVSSMKNTYGVNIYALSIQNEPDNTTATGYESCLWSGSQIHDFVTNLYSALAAKGAGSTKIILPESQNWSTDSGLYTPTLNDAGTLADASIVADHNYVSNNQIGDTNAPAALSVSGKALWETEVSQIGGSFDGSINNALYWAGRIHLYMTVAQANAWHFWWLIPLAGNTDNQGLTDVNGNPAKRMYVLGQFARFVRPNYYRIGANNSGSVQISAYKDSLSPGFAIVAINTNNSSVSQTFNLTNFPGVSTVTPWVTSGSLSLSSQTAVAVTNSSFIYTLPAMSVVTFAGAATGAASPTTGTNLVFVPVANTNINAGTYLTITNVAYVTNGTAGGGGGGGSSTLTLLGSWQNGTGDGWIDWGDLLSITNSSNTSVYSFASGVVSGYTQSLKIADSGNHQNLAIKLENIPGGMAAFLTNDLLQFTFSVPSSASSGATAGYSQVYQLAINASGYGFNGQPFSNFTETGTTNNNQSGMPNFYFSSGTPAQSQVVTVNYSSILPAITATASTGYIELIFSFNNGGGAPAYYYMNNVVLTH